MSCTIHYLESSVKFGNYSIEREAGGLQQHVSQNENGGMGARHLRLPTPLGIKKILRNILALQQSVRTLTNEQE
ncbi:Sec8 exocyst complex component specific domain-containing protein [Mycena indigotica]|uniref:Sec8 exocyst complex component specific domain-containing protein n=1 Tax=Mycena indigotica TaxID=2126181 RepID=A0A8H6WBM7_9AGAR|nr:Sec8 exocyst complex component specific domain-containing protein [Mycena indigotica]KAF7312779.1 Sec8 exocyst complex component specific domain-containing protein [Mycena indigotica]